MIVKHRLVSSLHGLIACVMGAYWWAFEYDMSCGKENSTFEMLISSVTSGYLLGDFIFMLVNGFMDLGNLIHHIMGIFSYTFPLHSYYNGNLMA
jgi:hypothetical protein